MGVMVLLPVLVFCAVCQASPAPAPATYYHHYRSPALSWSVVSSGSSLPHSFNSFLNQKSANPPTHPLLQPHNFAFPFLPPSPWNTVQDNLNRISGNVNHQHTEDVSRPFNTLIGSLLRPSITALGSIIDQMTYGFKEMNKNPFEFLPQEDAVNVDYPNFPFHANVDKTFDIENVFSSIFDDIIKDSKKNEKEIKDLEEKTLDDIINDIFVDHGEDTDIISNLEDIQFYPIQDNQQFVTEEDIEEAITMGDENIIDAIEEEDRDIDEILNEEEENIFSSTKNDQFYEILNSVVNQPEIQDDLEEYDVEIQEEDMHDENKLDNVSDNKEDLNEEKINSQIGPLDVTELLKDIKTGNIITNEV